ncbi:hypothetical protein BGX31_006097 [Mortierella sp. GBA43]|nr:hypothetical protein BGX31_006097 [Mortierella sp. GBA43]
MVKTRLQNQKPDAMGKLQYRGGLDCFRQVVAKEGVRGLYRGIVPNLIGITPEKAIKLAVNDFTREYLAERSNVSEDKLAIKYGMLAGATAGFCQVIATNPMEIVKIQMQVAGSQKLEPGEQRPTAMGILQGADKDGKISFSVVLGAGLASGVVAASAVTPADVIKTRLQVARKPGDPVYKGIGDCFQQIVRNEGVPALFKGVVPRSLIVAPMFAIALAVYELQQRLMGTSAADIGSSRTSSNSHVLMMNDKK